MSRILLKLCGKSASRQVLNPVVQNTSWDKMLLLLYFSYFIREK